MAWDRSSAIQCLNWKGNVEEGKENREEGEVKVGRDRGRKGERRESREEDSYMCKLGTVLSILFTTS